MKLIDLPANNIFIFKGDSYPYLRVDTGFSDIFEERFWKLEDTELTSEVIKIDRSFIWKEGAKLSIQQITVEEKIKQALEKYKKTDGDIESRVEYLFGCTNCKKGKRRSTNLNKAKDRLCRKCRKIKNQTTDMIQLFGKEEKWIEIKL